MQQSESNRVPPDSRPTRQNTQPNSVQHVRKHGPTYRARPATGGQPGGSGRDLLADRANAHMEGTVRRRRMRTVLFLVLGLFAVGGLAAYAIVGRPIVETVKTAIDTSNRIFVTPVPLRPAPGGSPNATPVTVVYPNWDKKEPVNILLLGLDYRPQEKDSRTDTMIIVHVDPAAKTASMVSIPRDLWVEIPGHEPGRINSAFQIGEDEESTTPGGGPGLAMAAVEENFGTKIHYFAQVDFTGFEKIVDTMGGITVDVPKPLVDNEYPLSNYGTTRIYVPAGLQHLDGKTALEYARSRHSDSDIGRNSRQQQVLMAIRQQGLNLNLISHLNELLTQLSGAVKTDLTISQVGSLAQLAREINRDSIQTVLIDNEMVNETILSNGADVLLPKWDLIRPKIALAFSDPQVAKEAARLSVQNGTTVNGAGRKVRDQLVAQGFSVPDLSAAPDQGAHPKSEIIDYTGGQKPHTVAKLAELLGIDPGTVREQPASKAILANSDGKPVDILVVAGDDHSK